MMKSFTTVTALASVLVALTSAAGAGPVQLAQMNVTPKIQPAPPPNLARTPVIAPRIDASRLAEEEDEAEKETDANPEQVPQETATGAEAPEIARQIPPPSAAAPLTRAPLPQARPELFGGLSPEDLLDARGAAEAREAAEAAAMAGVGVEHSDLGGLGDPSVGDEGGDPKDPRLGGMSPDEYKERFGLGGASPEEIAHGLATEFNDLGNRGTNSAAGDFADGFRPDPTKLPTGGLASNEPNTVEVEEVVITGSVSDGANDDTTIEVVHTGGPDQGSATQTIREKFPDGTEIVTNTTWYADGRQTEGMQVLDPDRGTVYHTLTTYDADGNVVYDVDLNRLQTPEDAPGGGAGCAPSDGSAACQELRRLQREGNSPARLMAGATRVNPGDPDDGATGDGPRIWMSEEDLLGNPDPHSLGRGGAGSGQGINDGTHINVEGGGTGTGQ